MTYQLIVRIILLTKDFIEKEGIPINHKIFLWIIKIDRCIFKVKITKQNQRKEFVKNNYCKIL